MYRYRNGVGTSVRKGKGSILRVVLKVCWNCFYGDEAKYYSRTLLYLVLYWGEQHQDPNAETDHPECSTPPGISTLGSTNLLKYPYVPLYSAGMHFFIKQTRWAGVLSVPKAGSSSNGGLQIMLPLFHSPLFHFKVGTPLASKNFRSTFLSLVWWSNVATIQPNTTLALVQPLTVTADTIQKYIWCSHTHC
eukprot:Em0010g110a